MKFFMNHLSSAKILTRPFAILNLYQIYSYNDRHFTFNLTGVNYSAVSSYLGEKIALEFKDKCNFSDLKDFKCEAAGELKVKKFIRIQKIGTSPIILNVLNSFNVPTYAKLDYFEE